MKKTSTLKKLMSILLSVVMVATMLPTFAISAFADDETIVWKFDASQTSATGNGSTFSKGAAYKVVDPSNNNSFIQGIYWNETDQNCNASNSGYVHGEDIAVSGGFGSTTGFGTQKLCGDHWIFQYRYAYLAKGKGGNGSDATDNNSASVFALGNNGANVINITSDGNVYLNGSATATTTIDRTKFICTDKADVRTAAFEYDHGTLTFSVKGETLFTTTAVTGNPDITNFFMGASKVTTAGGTMQYVGPTNTGNLLHGMYIYKLIASNITESESNAIVKSGTLNPLKRTLITGSGSRLSSSNWNIVNDQEAGNTSAGVVKYSITDLKNTNATSASLSFQITTAPLGDYQGLTFYWTTDTSKVEGLLNDGEQQGKITGSGSYGSGVNANQKVANTLGFSVDNNKLVSLAKSSNTANTYNLDIPKATLQKIIDTNSDVVYIVCMQSQAGGSGSNGGWTDTIVDPTTIKLTYNCEIPDKSKEEVLAAFNAVPSNPTVKSSTLTESEDGSVKKTSLYSTDKMSNVLYMYGSGGSAKFEGYGDSNWHKGGAQYGDMTFLDDGVTDMGAPISCYIQSTTSWGNSKDVRPRTATTEAPFFYKAEWHSGHKDDSAGYFTTSGNTMNYGQNSNNFAEPSSQAVFKSGNTWRYSNTMYVDRTKITYGDNYRYTNTSQKHHHYNNCNGQDNDRSFTVSSNIRVINYAPLANIIRGIKNNTLTEYKNISESHEHNYYTGSSTVQYLNALKEICNFDPNSYFGKSTNNYDACCKEIKRLVDQYNNAVGDLKLNTYTVTFKYQNGKELTKKVKRFGTVTCPNDDSPAVTSKFNADQHSITRYYWGPADKSIVKDMVYNELNEVSYYDHEWVAGTRVEPTCTVDGSQAYECSVCGQTKTETLTKTGHEWNLSAGVANYATDATYDSAATYTHKVTCNNDSSHKDDVVCSFPAEWTVDGDIERKTCSVCGGTITQPHIVGHTITFKDADGNDIDIVTTLDGETPNAPNLAQFTKIDAEGHHTFSWDKALATATEDTTYTLVENEVIPHAYAGDYIVSKATTCSEEGSEYRVCTVDANCTFHDTRSIEKSPHTFGAWIYNESMLKQHHICSVCDEDVYDNCSFKVTEEVKATCTENGHTVYTCTDCGGSYTEYAQALGHDDVDALERTGVVAEACTTDGYTGDKICSKCGTILDRGSVIPALGHANIDTFVPATCTEDGYWTSRCTRCGEDFGVIDYNYVADKTKNPGAYIAWAYGRSENTYDGKRHNETYTVVGNNNDVIDHMVITFTYYIGGTYVGDHDHFSIIEGDANGTVKFNLTSYNTKEVTETVKVSGDTFTYSVYKMKKNDSFYIDSIKVYPKYPAIGHDYVGTHHEKTTLKCGYTTYVCSNDPAHTYNEDDADTSLVSLDAYNSALLEAQSIIDNTDKYSDSVISTLQTVINDNLTDTENGDTQSALDTKVANILSAITVAEKNPNYFEVTFDVQDNTNGTVITKVHDKKHCAYGDTLVLNAEGNVYKWVRTDSKGNDSIFAKNASSVTLVVYEDITITAYVSSETTTIENPVKVTLLDKTGRTAGIAYTSAESSITVDDTYIVVGGVKLEAVQVPYYSAKGFKIGSQSYSSQQGTYTIPSGVTELTVRPIYDASNLIVINSVEGVTINGANVRSKTAKWDDTITLATDDNREVLWCAGDVVLAQGSTYRFRANESITITVKDIEAVDPSAKVGYFAYDEALNKVTVVNNFFAPSGNVDCAGVVLSTKTSDIEALKNQTNGRFQTTNYTENNNQVKISVSRSAKTAFTMYALAYVVVDGVTYYADSVATCTYSPQA